MRKGQFLFWAVVTVVAAASAGVVYRTIEPLPPALTRAQKPAVRELPASAVAALNRCFDANAADLCSEEAAIVLQSLALANESELGVVETGGAFNVAYLLRSDITAETSVVFWQAPCEPQAFAADMFVANIFPRMKQDLNKDQVDKGFSVHGFPPAKRAVRLASGEGCVAAQRLPDYPLTRMIVGQYNRAGLNKGFVWMQKMALNR